jgi:hypothetical protein
MEIKPQAVVIPKETDHLENAIEVVLDLKRKIRASGEPRRPRRRVAPD